MVAEARCPRCGRTLPLTPEYWYRNRARPNGFAEWCKDCRKAYVRTPEYRAYNRQREQLPRRQAYRQGSHILRIDDEVYALIVAGKAALEVQRGRPVSMNEAVADLMREAEHTGQVEEQA